MGTDKLVLGKAGDVEGRVVDIKAMAGDVM